MGSQKKSSQEKKKTFAPTLVALLLLLTAAFLVWSSREVQPREPGPLSKAKNYDDLVNLHLQETYKNIQRQQIQAEIANDKEAPSLSETAPNKINRPQDLSLEFKQDPRIKEIPEMTGRAVKPELPDDVDPKVVIQKRLHEEQRWNEYSQAYREAYAKQFIENARRGGWDIKLNHEFKVLSVKPIKKDNRPYLFRKEVETPN